MDFLCSDHCEWELYLPLTISQEICDKVGPNSVDRGRTNIRGNGEFLANIVLLHVLPMYYLVPHLPAASKLLEYLSPLLLPCMDLFPHVYTHTPLKTLTTQDLSPGRIIQIVSPSGFWARLVSPRPTGKNSTELRNGSSHLYQPSSSK